MDGPLPKQMGSSLRSNHKKNVSCFDIGEVPRSPGKWNWNWLSFLPFIFIFEQCEGAFNNHVEKWGKDMYLPL